VIRRNAASAQALLIAVVVCSGIALVRHDGARLRPYLQVVAVLVVLAALADRTAHFSQKMVAALTSVAIVHLIGGLMTPIGDAPTFYETWLIPDVLKFDQLAHLYGSAVLTVACAHFARGASGLPVVAALMACGLGAINELVEFLFGLDNPNFHAGGLQNTGWDLAFNLAGAVIAGTWIATGAIRAPTPDPLRTPASRSAR
jgi:hypothetical protein